VAARTAVPDLRDEVYAETIASLHDGRYLDTAILRGGVGKLVNVRIRRLLPAGRRAIGQWPTGDLADQLFEELRQQIDLETDEAKRGALKRLLDAAGGVGKEVLVAVLIRLAERASGLG
jgi:hypothetical protein